MFHNQYFDIHRDVAFYILLLLLFIILFNIISIKLFSSKKFLSNVMHGSNICKG